MACSNWPASLYALPEHAEIPSLVTRAERDGFFPPSNPLGGVAGAGKTKAAMTSRSGRLGPSLTAFRAAAAAPVEPRSQEKHCTRGQQASGFSGVDR